MLKMTDGFKRKKQMFQKYFKNNFTTYSKAVINSTCKNKNHKNGFNNNSAFFIICENVGFGIP